MKKVFYFLSSFIISLNIFCNLKTKILLPSIPESSMDLCRIDEWDIHKLRIKHTVLPSFDEVVDVKHSKNSTMISLKNKDKRFYDGTPIDLHDVYESLVRPFNYNKPTLATPFFKESFQSKDHFQLVDNDKILIEHSIDKNLFKRLLNELFSVMVYPLGSEDKFRSVCQSIYTKMHTNNFILDWENLSFISTSNPQSINDAHIIYTSTPEALLLEKKQFNHFEINTGGTGHYYWNVHGRIGSSLQRRLIISKILSSSLDYKSTNLQTYNLNNMELNIGIEKKYYDKKFFDFLQEQLAINKIILKLRITRSNKEFEQLLKTKDYDIIYGAIIPDILGEEGILQVSHPDNIISFGNFSTFDYQKIFYDQSNDSGLEYFYRHYLAVFATKIPESIYYKKSFMLPIDLRPEALRKDFRTWNKI